MTYVKLVNENLTVLIEPWGAEIQSICAADGTEFLWQGDQAFWGRRAPVLFPVVGKLKENKYYAEGREYQLTQHGFARDLPFTVTCQEKTKVVFTLEADEETLQKYPYRFSLSIAYELIKHQLTVQYMVKNIDDKTMYFSIGAHPGFAVPIGGDGVFEDYMIEILPRKTRQQIPVTAEVLLETNKAFENTDGKIPLSRERFANGVLIFETAGKTEVCLSSEKSQRRIVFSYQDMPYLGIWSPYPEEAPFVCIEPWCGVADTADASGKLSEKLGIQSLGVQEVFTASYAIAFSK